MPAAGTWSIISDYLGDFPSSRGHRQTHALDSTFSLQQVTQAASTGCATLQGLQVGDWEKTSEAKATQSSPDSRKHASEPGDGAQESHGHPFKPSRENSWQILAYSVLSLSLAT